MPAQTGQSPPSMPSQTLRCSLTALTLRTLLPAGQLLAASMSTPAAVLTPMGVVKLDAAAAVAKSLGDGGAGDGGAGDGAAGNRAQDGAASDSKPTEPGDFSLAVASDASPAMSATCAMGSSQANSAERSEANPVCRCASLATGSATDASGLPVNEEGDGPAAQAPTTVSSEPPG